GTGSVASGLAGGIYTVIVTGGNCNVTKTVSIGQSPGASLTVSGNTIVCAGSAVILTAGGASSYTWSNGSNTPTTSINSSGTYTVYAATSPSCSTSKTVAVT